MADPMNFKGLKRENPLIFDGAMGTNLSEYLKSAPELVKSELVCNEAYNLFFPDAVEKVHRLFIDAGAGVIETNSFNGNSISLSEYGLDDRVEDINKQAVSIAKKAIQGLNRKIFISGSVGPTGKLPSLGQTDFDTMYDAYRIQISLLVDQGVDFIQIETSQDILQSKIAVIASNDILKERNKNIPVIVSVTVDEKEKMLLGSELDAVLATFIPLGVSVIGLNCGVGPDGMDASARYLAHHSPVPILLQPNAGLPKVLDGKPHYEMDGNIFAEKVGSLVKELSIEMVGGCCGTGPEHISKLKNYLSDFQLKRRKISGWKNSLSSLYSSVPVNQIPRPLIVGERMNINGSKKFKKKLLAEDFDNAVQIAIEQEKSGAHILDISVAYPGRDENLDMRGVLEQVRGRSCLPISIDSTSADVILEALKLIPGRSLINSINLEDGGMKAAKVIDLAARFGAAIIGLTIDENGMARERSKKCETACRLIDMITMKGLDLNDIFIDPLTFTLADPQAASFGSGLETLEAIEMIKKKYPEINIILGVSNISYGFKKAARKVLNSVFFYEALDRGLDAAIIHSGQILPFKSIDRNLLNKARKLIFSKNKNALTEFVSFFEDKKNSKSEKSRKISSDEGIANAIIDGDREAAKRYLEVSVKERDAKSILNDLLMPAMKEVGRRFDKGEMPLPFVLQSAETMKFAADFLSEYFNTIEEKDKGRILLATVKGDVHDIGKNLVDIILSNNGYKVFNIGVGQSIEDILEHADKNRVQAIGLSGLLVESALIMKDDLAELARRGVNIPVICGGAALNNDYVNSELRSAYKGKVFYASDAFEGLKIVEKILNG